MAVVEKMMELAYCEESLKYFVWNFCQIKDENSGRFIPFHLWDCQADALKTLKTCRLLVLLKARQIGMTTIVICYAIWLALFRPGSTILVFSKGQQEARDVLKRIKDIIRHLPTWLRPAAFKVDTAQQCELTNTSRIITFASNSSGGDSYTASLVIVDEADLIPDLDRILSGCKPTVDQGGQLVMLSRVDKTDPQSSFKRTYRAAVKGESPYAYLFFPWHSRPGRSREWYDDLAREIEGRTFSRDELYANYPATPDEALSARELDKRFPVAWLAAVFQPQSPLPAAVLRGTPFEGWTGLEIYKAPELGRTYLVGIDVAWGNPNSDDSVALVIDKANGEEVAVLCGRIEPGVHAHRSSQLAEWYNRAELLPERNGTHGQKCLDTLKHLRCRILRGRDGKPGWYTDPIGKNIMYDNAAEAVRTGSCILHSQGTYEQLLSIDVTELAAPFGFKDDRAIAFGLCIQGISKMLTRPDITVVTVPEQTPAQAQAQPAPQGNSKFAGVQFIPTYNSWVASVMIDGRKKVLGEFPTERLAALAVNVALEVLEQPTPNLVALGQDEQGQAEMVREQIKVVMRG